MRARIQIKECENAAKYVLEPRHGLRREIHPQLARQSAPLHSYALSFGLVRARIRRTMGDGPEPSRNAGAGRGARSLPRPLLSPAQRKPGRHPLPRSQHTDPTPGRPAGPAGRPGRPGTWRGLSAHEHRLDGRSTPDASRIPRGRGVCGHPSRGHPLSLRKGEGVPGWAPDRRDADGSGNRRRRRRRRRPRKRLRCYIRRRPRERPRKRLRRRAGPVAPDPGSGTRSRAGSASSAGGADRP